MHDAHHLAIMAQILTAMSVEALHSTDEYFHPSIGQVRPHPGQVSFPNEFPNITYSSTKLCLD